MEAVLSCRPPAKLTGGLEPSCPTHSGVGDTLLGVGRTEESGGQASVKERGD